MRPLIRVALVRVALVCAALAAGSANADDAKIEAQIDGQLADWRRQAQAIAESTVDHPPPLARAAERVINALEEERRARAELAAADADATGVGPPALPTVHLVRPRNDLAAELTYAEKMLGIHRAWLAASEADGQRSAGIADALKTAAKEDARRIAKIDEWQWLLGEERDAVARTATLYADHSQPGWFDRATLADKFDLAAIRLKLAAARRRTQPEPVDPLLEKQSAAAGRAIEAGRATYEAMAAFYLLTTREGPIAADSSCAANPQNTKPASAAIWDVVRLAAAPAHRWLDDAGSPARRILFRGEPYQGHPTDVFAYFASPTPDAGVPPQAGRFPALVLLHGGGDRASRDWVALWAKRGYAAISVDLAGGGPAPGTDYDRAFKPARLPRGGPGQDGKRKLLDIDLPITDQWPYHAVANAILAHSLVRSLPQVDPDRTAVAGISWGGYLTCITAAVDDRFNAAMPFYGCGFIAERSVWQENGLFAELAPEQRERWVALWDPANYAPRIRMPVFAVTGAKDFAYPLESFAKTYALPAGACSFRITADMGHGGQFLTTTPEAVAFLDAVLRGGQPIPAPGTPRVEGAAVAVALNGTAAKSAAFHWTDADGPSTSRPWHSIAVAEKDGELSATVPEGMRIGYFTFQDARGLTFSSAAFTLENQ